MAMPRRAAKRPESGTRAGRLGVLAIALFAAQGALAQTVRITPSVDTRLTWTDNVGKSDDDRRADWIAEVAPGIEISRDSGRFNGSLRARLRNVAYAEERGRSKSFVALSGRGEIEAVERLLFVDLGASITRNNLSAFSGASSADDVNVAEESEVRTWTLAPRLEFSAGDVRGILRYLARWLEGGGGALSGQRLGEWSLQLSDPGYGRLFGWGVDYRHGRTEYDDRAFGEVTEAAGRATLFVNLSPQFRLRAIGGHESNEYSNGGTERGAIYGGGFDWYPNERLAISALTEERFFGRGYHFSLNYRRPQSTWNLIYSKDVSSSLRTLGGGIFEDPLFLQFYNAPEVIAQLPDAAQREAFVRQLLGYPSTGMTDAIRSNSYFLQRSFGAGFTLQGVRNVLSFSVRRSDRDSLGSISGLSAEDDFAISSRIKTNSATVTLSHRLSGISSLNLSATRSHTDGSSSGGGRAPETRRLLISVGMTTQLGARTFGGLNYRHQRADGSGGGNDFTENAVIANLGMQF